MLNWYLYSINIDHQCHIGHQCASETCIPNGLPAFENYRVNIIDLMKPTNALPYENFNIGSFP